MRVAQQWWGARCQLLPTIVSLVLLFILTVGAALNGGTPLAGLVGADPARHVVAQGDTVAKIAEQYGTTPDVVASINGLPDADLIYPGQELSVPSTGAAAPVAGGGAHEHTVVEGDTLWAIALKYEVDLEALYEANAALEDDVLQVGQKIIIPTGDARGPGATRSAQRREDPYGRIWIPFRSQLDGSAAAGSNCGPATLGMLMSYFGEWWTTAGIRRSVNEYQGTWDPDAGSTWEAIAYAARKRGFRVIGLYNAAGGYRQWTIDDLVAQTKAGRPVMLLTRYWSLPGHANSDWWGDHYIAFLGLTPGGEVIYHDAAFPDEASGAYRTMSKDQLIRAWTRTSTGQQYTAMALEWPAPQ